jgi:hypothetical protein
VEANKIRPICYRRIQHIFIELRVTLFCKFILSVHRCVQSGWTWYEFETSGYVLNTMTDHGHISPGG